MIAVAFLDELIPDLFIPFNGYFYGRIGINNTTRKIVKCIGQIILSVDAAPLPSGQLIDADAGDDLASGFDTHQ